MGSRYLVDLADVLRAAGLSVVEVEGWQSRGRGSGGYDSGKPDHCMCLHTASGASMDGWGDVNYMTFNHQDAPLCNLYLARDGTWYVCAAGATNTNGSGDCPHLSPDTMNSSAIGIEGGNNGVGEPWPTAQQDSYVAGVAALCDAYRIPLDHVHGHAEWAPSRKIDMAGNSRYATGGSTWDFDQFRRDIEDVDGGGGQIPPPPGPDPLLRRRRDTVQVISNPRTGDINAFVVGEDKAVYWCGVGPRGDLTTAPFTPISEGWVLSVSACYDGDDIVVVGQGIEDGAGHQTMWVNRFSGGVWSGWVENPNAWLIEVP